TVLVLATVDASVSQVKVLLRVQGATADQSTSASCAPILSVDRRRKQVSLLQPPPPAPAPAPADERRVPAVAAPKMFSFDAIFSSDDSQAEVASSALADVVHAVVNGADGCVFSFGHARLGKTQTMVGAASPAGALGVVPCALSWLFRAIADHKQRTGARFSVRVSAVEVCASMADLLAGHASESGGEPSPGSLLSDEPPLSEVRAPSAERAAALLEAALANRRHAASVLLFRLHVYQYHGRAVSAGRSRLHLLDLGSCKSQQGDLPPSALANVLLAIINGNRHLPYREHKLSQLLRECLGSLTCHTTMIAHVSAAADHYTDTLATLQFASRVHRMRRLRVKFGLPGEPGHLQHAAGACAGLDGGHSTSTGSSDVDPSSSEQSADTVIYVGPAADDATDGEHPPVYLPGTGLLRQRKMGVGATGKDDTDGKQSRSATTHLNAAKPSPSKAGSRSPNKTQQPPGLSVDHAPTACSSSPSSTQRKTALQQHTCPPASAGASAKSSAGAAEVSDERWIDGPRVSRSKLEEARSLIKSTHKKNEAWVDGPLQSSVTCNGGPDVPLGLATPLTTSTVSGSIYAGFAENQKKRMIKKWVESQTAQSQKQQVEGQAPPPAPVPKAVVAPVEAVVTQQPRPTATKELLRLENGYARVGGQTSAARDPEVLESCYKASEYLAETMNIDYRNDAQFMSSRSATVCALSKVQEVLVSPVLHTPVCRAVSLSRSASLFLDTERTSRCSNGKDDALRKVNSLRVGKTVAANYVCDEVAPTDTCESPDVYSRLKDFDLQGSEASAEEDMDITRGEPEECKTDSASLGSSSDADVVEVEETCEIVQMQDSCLQVSEDDIARCMGNKVTREHSATVGDHPLQMLSQDNLSTSSSFTDSLSAATDPLPRYRGGGVGVGCWQPQQRPSSLYDEAEEGVGVLSAASDSLAVKRVVGGGCGGGGGGGGLAASEDRLQELARLHQMYKRKLASIWLAPSSPHVTQQPPSPASPTPQAPAPEKPLPPPPPLRTPTLLACLERPLPPPPPPLASRFQSASLCDVAFSDDGAYSDASIYSEPAISYAADTAQRPTKLCVNCKLNFSLRPSDNNLWLTTPTPTLEALAHPPLPPRWSSRAGGGGVDKQSGCSIASLRRPDGCSNPDLKEEADRPARAHRLLQGNGYLPKSFSRLEEAVPPTPPPDRSLPATDTPTPPATPPAPRLYRRLLGKVSARLPPVAARLGCGRLVDSCASHQRSRSAVDADVDADAESLEGVCRASNAATAATGGAGGEPVAEQRQTAATAASGPTAAHRVSVLEYCLEDVARLERRWTERSARRLRRLRDQQLELKLELALTKARLLLPASRWDFDLHVEESMDARDPAFLEALQRETEILAKRVAAAKSRIMIVTCFDVTPRCSR
ncbi:uncharacterized protein LOC126278929, partial [Schistocerca gregaria]|uniref:uncharacterized protein LOC126278929 n=1 Tax=Schistocerca gregaria TaxID=7010 RepID=UPI00211E5ED9